MLDDSEPRRGDEPQAPSLIIHGHFYQPPRENPWLDAIEREPGAAPFPNWNARIADECYRANGWARIYDDHGLVEDIANNYLRLSFNFGPTLLTWLQVHEPRTYARILEADRQSVALHAGHGNALCQSYGHAILPLCNQADRLTLIRWGKRDFEDRFGRPAEALWLPETAIDADTVEDLIDEGLTFVVLSPYQARRVRRPGESGFRDVSGGKVDPRQAYRLASRRQSGRFLSVFFYDGPVSHGISFERALSSSRQLVDRLWGAVDQSRGAQLVHAAVDGETFGHHHKHAERALAYALTTEAHRRGFRLTNYGEFLEHHPAEWEVELEPGPDGEGTAWSCAHGVGRWYRDCGCNAGSPPGWNQKWRGPLRRAVELVRDEAARVFAEMGGELLQDPYAARDEAVVLLGPSLPAGLRTGFLARHARNGHSLTKQTRIFKLLEMQRFSLLSQTSCGWFFNDIAGLEAIQVMRYTARAVQLLEDLSGRQVEPRLLEVLAEARSNVPDEGTGADIYRRRVLTAAVSTRRHVAQYAITDMFRGYPDDLRRHGRHVHRLERHFFSSGHLTLTVGRVEVEHLRTTETDDLVYVLIHFGGHDFHCAVRNFPGAQEHRAFTHKLKALFGTATVTELLRAVDAHFGDDYFGLPQLLAEEREEVLQALFQDMSEGFAQMYTRLYMDNRRTVNALVESGLKVPTEFRIAAEYTLSRQLNEEIQNQRSSRERDRYRRAEEIVKEAEQAGYHLDLAQSETLFGSMLAETIEDLVEAPSDQACLDALGTLALAKALSIRVPLDRPQEAVLELLRRPQGLGQLVDGELLLALSENLGLSQNLIKDVKTLKFGVKDPSKKKRSEVEKAI